MKVLEVQGEAAQRGVSRIEQKTPGAQLGFLSKASLIFFLFLKLEFISVTYNQKSFS
jgi:hypothetical protein